MKNLFLLYRRVISPVLGFRCRFHPSCSRYAEEALHHYGWIHGACAILRRLSKCHPFNPGGYDPVAR